MSNLARLRLAGFWTQNSVVDPQEFEDFDAARPKLANFEDGSTHAPSAFVTVGGSGFQFTGTGHSLAASARLNVESTGEIRLKNGSLLKADGSGGDIRLEVLTNVATLTIQSGAVMDIAGAANVTGNLDIESAGELNLKSGGTLTAESGSTVTLSSGATVTIAANATMSGDMTVSSGGSIVFQSGGTITGASGSTVTLQGTTNLYELKLIGSASWVVFNTARTWLRAGAVVLPLSYAGTSTGPDDPDIWTEVSDATTAPCYRTRSATSSGGKSLIEFRDLPIGGEITSVTITTKGTNLLSIVATMPTYRIVSWEDSSAAGLTTHSSLTTDAGTAGSFPATETQTTISATGTPTVTAGRRYGLLINHPFESPAGQAMRIYEITMNGTVEEHQL